MEPAPQATILPAKGDEETASGHRLARTLSTIMHGVTPGGSLDLGWARFPVQAK
jgi:hypothetical protein